MQLLLYARIGRWLTHITCNDFHRSTDVKLISKRSPFVGFFRFWKLYSNMDVKSENIQLVPPECVRGMTELNRNMFNYKVQVPYFSIQVEKLTDSLRVLKPHLLKLTKFTSIEDADDNKKNILLSPAIPNSKEILKNLEKELEEEVNWKEVLIEYKNWKADEILKAVLPPNVDGSTSYSRIGHIIQLNLRDHLTDYRFLIGQVLLDKIAGITLVVNKKNVIESTFRNFEMETLAGSGSSVTTVKENNSTYTFDFADVYWNPRLSTEHERIIKMLNPYDVLFDVFAGVGPFSIPCAKKKCQVFANDLNPHSYSWLEKNIKQNKVVPRIEIFNLDGREFIKTSLKDNLLKIWRDGKCGKLTVTPGIHVVMNLPAIAVEFLDSFEGLFSDYREEFKEEELIYPKVHVYMFVRSSELEKTAFKMTRDALNLPETFELEYFYVRHVAPMKDMVRISFLLTREILFDRNCNSESDLPVKRIRLDLD